MPLRILIGMERMRNMADVLQMYRAALLDRDYLRR